MSKFVEAFFAEIKSDQCSMRRDLAKKIYSSLLMVQFAKYL